MILLFISDTHDRVDHIKMVLEMAKKEHVDVIIHCGDLVEPETLHAFDECKLPVYYVFGNNEGREEEILRLCEEKNIRYFLDMGEFEIDHRRIAITHYPRVAETLFTFGKFDVVAYGHSHYAKVEQNKQGAYLLNPGNLAGLRQDSRYALYDTRTHKITMRQLQTRVLHYHFDEDE